ncbi:MAG: hypothetical protein P8X94_12100, partial [Woeseiaceae bacterium]
DTAAELVAIARENLHEAGIQYDQVTDWRAITLATLAAVEGDTDTAEQFIKQYFRGSGTDWANRVGNRDFVCQLLAIAGAAEAAVQCIREGLAEPSRVMPFLEPVRTACGVDRHGEPRIVAAASCAIERHARQEVHEKRPIGADQHPGYRVTPADRHAVARAIPVPELGTAILSGPHLYRVFAAPVALLRDRLGATPHQCGKGQCGSCQSLRYSHGSLPVILLLVA